MTKKIKHYFLGEFKRHLDDNIWVLEKLIENSYTKNNEPLFEVIDGYKDIQHLYNRIRIDIKHL